MPALNNPEEMGIIGKGILQPQAQRNLSLIASLMEVRILCQFYVN